MEPMGQASNYLKFGGVVAAAMLALVAIVQANKPAAAPAPEPAPVAAPEMPDVSCNNWIHAIRPDGDGYMVDLADGTEGHLTADAAKRICPQ